MEEKKVSAFPGRRVRTKDRQLLEGCFFVITHKSNYINGGSGDPLDGFQTAVLIREQLRNA